MVPTYEQRATTIISEAIKSAIFIDERALEPYMQKSEEVIKEEDLSITLFENFKSNSISLAVHKFRVTDLEDNLINKYLFDDRDLVLLDWKLDGESGELYSLQLLSKVIQRGHIHFCSIYTSVDSLDGVLDNILSYFSNKDEKHYEDIRLELAEYETDIKRVLPRFREISLHRYAPSCGQMIGDLMKTESKLVKGIRQSLSESDTKCAIIKTYTAFGDFLKSDVVQPCPKLISPEAKILVIENTVISILQKDYDNDPQSLIQKISTQVASASNSFTQLLGLEMQNIFSRKGAFIDSNLLEISKEAILHHRKQLKEHDGIDIPFKDFIKEILQEHAKTCVRTENLTLLDDDFLDGISKDIRPAKEDELVIMNVFYNSTRLKDNKAINFGDVFKDNGDNYFLCVNSVCDCLRPDKVNNLFYFVRGENIDKHEALLLGDTAFTSFISPKVIVKWTRVDTVQQEKLHRYRPVYIKPESFTVPKYQFDDNGKISALSLSVAGEVTTTEMEYVTTIKQAYAQRIANHTFSYPVRVGIDFATLIEPK